MLPKTRIICGVFRILCVVWIPSADSPILNVHSGKTFFDDWETDNESLSTPFRLTSLLLFDPWSTPLEIANAWYLIFIN